MTAAADLSFGERVLCLRARCLQVLRALELRMQHALEGGDLRGLKAIGRPGFQAAQVHGSKAFGIDTFLSPGRPSICLGKHGRFIVAMQDDQVVTWHDLRDEEFKIEDFEPACRCACEALRRHARRMRLTGQRYKRASILVARLDVALT